nr:hypothetical protein Iba_chr13cCG13470 [Ipomoea batatas]
MANRISSISSGDRFVSGDKSRSINQYPSCCCRFQHLLLLVALPVSYYRRRERGRKRGEATTAGHLHLHRRPREFILQVLGANVIHIHREMQARSIGSGLH